MTLPGTTVTSRADSPARTAPTDTSVFFLVGDTSTGTNDPKLVTSMAAYIAEYGERDTYGPTYDAAECFFREGGSQLYVTRVGDENLSAALARIPNALGPGQVAAPGYTGSSDHGDLLDHAAANNRIALLDCDPELDAEDLAAAGIALSADDNARYGTLLAPRVSIPGLAPGTTRECGFSGIAAGLIARVDAKGSPNVAAAGVNGISSYAVDVDTTYTDAQRETLNDAGVNVARNIYGAVRLYGYRTLVSPDTAAAVWLSLGNARLNMAIVAKAESVAEGYLFAQLDGKRQTITAFGGALAGVLVPYYEAGSLYGATPEEAFLVDVDQVNTPETIAAGELHAVLSLRMSPFAERVVVEIVKKSNTEAL